MKYNPIISYFHGGIRNTNKVVDTSLEKFIEQIRTNESWKKKVSHVRNVLNKYGKGLEYKEAKRQLHYFMPCGTFTTRSKQGLKTVNGLLQGDIDNLTTEEMKRARKLLIQDKYTIALFNSPSNQGIKFFIRTNVTVKSPPSVKAVLNYYKSKYNLELDASTLNLFQACYISFDPEAMLNLKANLFTYALEEKGDSKHGGEIINNPSSSNQQYLNYCKMVIRLEAKVILEAGQGNGCFQLNKSAFKAGTYAGIGLDIGIAKVAFKEAFVNRKHSQHTEYEFNRIFKLGWDAGIKKPRSKK